MSEQKINAVLFDLDNTLLGNDVNRFLQSYFHLLGQYAARILPPDRFQRVLMTSTEAAIRSTDTAVTNSDVFWANFSQLTGLDIDGMKAFFEQFYIEKFPSLATQTVQCPVAPRLVQACLDAEVDVVVATNPLFPRIAIEQRLAWAGVPVTAYPYALVTTMENMHAAKPNPAYYLEIAARLALSPDAAVMVGDDWENDIVPANAVGMHTFWIADGNPPPDATIIDGSGSLADFYELVQQGWLTQPQSTTFA